MGASNQLGGAACTSSRNCWAVGSYGSIDVGSERNQALHWNGKKWSAR
jgi:hypothetical protein